MKLIKESKDDVKLRASAYVATAKIACRLPHVVSNDVALLQSFFDAVCQVPNAHVKYMYVFT